jgi:peptidyl-prolyl cis-trans isomerase C
MSYCIIVALRSKEKMRELCSLLVIVMLVSFAGGCKGNVEKKAAAGKTGASEETIVTVNGTPITVGEVNFRLRQSHHGVKLTPEVERQTIEDMVNQELMYQEGLRLGLDMDEKYRNAVRELEMRVESIKRGEMARMLYNAKIAAKAAISDEDVKKFYEENEGNMRTELHLLQVQFPDEAPAEKALERLKGGLSFDDLARERYGDVRKGMKEPWDLGFLRWNQIPSEWLEAVYSLKTGEVSGIIRGGRTGIRIFKLLEKRENPEAGLETMRAGIANRLRDERIKEEYDRYIKGLREKAKIVKREGWKLMEK